MNSFNSVNDVNNTLGNASSAANLLTPCVLSQVKAAVTAITKPAPPATGTQPVSYEPPTCMTGIPGECSNCVPPSCDATEYWDPDSCSCMADTSPIVIDTDGTGFHLTSATNGVMFDFYGDRNPIQIAWTAQGSTNGWLALDRNGNGIIDSAKELFGNITAQPPSSNPNGFLALAVFDQPANGGNSDGIIDNRDAVWPNLLVWIDTNHDGISQPAELHHLDEIGIHSIALGYIELRFMDAFGNQFRYKGSLNPDRSDNVDRVIYDVILAVASPQVTTSKAVSSRRWESRSFASLFPRSVGPDAGPGVGRAQLCSSTQSFAVNIAPPVAIRP